MHAFAPKSRTAVHRHKMTRRHWIPTDLQVHLRVPVAVEQDNDVCGVQVDAQAPGARGQQEDELLGALRVVGVDLRLAVLAAGVAINPAVLVACDWQMASIMNSQVGCLRVT